MANNSFSLDLYPKYVINSKGERKSFDDNNISKVLNKETGLDMQIAKKIAEDVIRKIIGLGVNEISTNYIRELVCVELTQRGMNKYRNLFARAINLENINFKIDEDFINQFKEGQPNWGPLGYITYKRTYARNIEGENRKEEYWETVRRVVEGCFSIQKEHCMKLSLPWNDIKAQKSAQKMFKKIWEFKFLPPGRGLWMMGTEFIARHGSMALNNCGFASTEDIAVKYTKAFEFVMDALMLGVGVGFDAKGAGKIKIKKPIEGYFDFLIPDSREGWVEALKLILEAYFLGKQIPKYDFSLIRPAGQPIRGFGGVASGPEPLKQMLEDIHKILENRIGNPITSVNIVDIMNYIGRCVVAGNVRRCLPKGTIIHTKDGLIPIEDLKQNMLVETTKGYFPVSELISQGEQEMTYIKSQIGTFKCTKNHQIAVLIDVGQYEWKKAMDLKPGDKIVFPIHIVAGKQTGLPKWSYEKPKHSTTCKDIIIPPLDEDIVWFLGYFHGDGCVMPNFENDGFNAEVNVAIDINHKDIIEKCKNQLQRFGVNIYIPQSEENCIKLRCMSKQLAWYFNQFKQAKKTITIPSFILQGIPNLRAAYLGGLFDADGSCLTRPIHLLSTIYPEFARQVKILYASLGIPTKIKKIDRSNITNWNDLYNVNLIGEFAIDRFEQLVKKFALKYQFTRKTKRSQNDFGFPSEWIKRSNFKYGREWTPQQKQMTIATYLKCGGDIKNLIPIEVMKVFNNNSEKVETFDITVDKAHEFIIEDGILVHNSAEIALGDPTDIEFVTCKQDKEKLYSHRWASNNSVFAVKGMDYSFIADQIVVNGEPGIFWLENARAYSRIGDSPDYKDKKAAGVNPCITGDMLIAVADGRNAISIKQLSEEGFDVPVYCKDKNGTTKIRMLRNPRITGYNQKIYEVQLDDGSIIKCTQNHKFLMKNRIMKTAIELKPGESLMIASKWQTIRAEIMKEKLISNGLCNNHKVVAVNYIGLDTVYNGTVDDFHNYGIVLNEKKTASGKPKLEIVFTANCGEQTLESFELCCLVENFPSRHDSYEEFEETLKYAYLYAKSVTLVNTHWKETNAVMLKNRRMGISQTGIIEAFVKHGRRTMLEWSDKAYKYLKQLDEEYSDWLCVPKSIKLTTVKPSGSVSLLPGVTPGIHFPHSKYYIRRMRISTNSDLYEPLKEAGYPIEKDKYSANSYVISFPIEEKYFDRSKNDVTIWEQAQNAADYQKYWSDNQVSITITFKTEEAKDIKRVLECYEDKLKSVSFLPNEEHGYEQPPYEEITKEQYEEMTSKIKEYNLESSQDRILGEKFCDSDKCEVKF